jgi:hypothetical protein
MSAHYTQDLARRVRKYLAERGEKPPSLAILDKLFEVLFFGEPASRRGPTYLV